MAPRILICGYLIWAQADAQRLLGNIAEIVVSRYWRTIRCIEILQQLDSVDRADFIKGFGPNGKYEGTIALFRDNVSAEKIGVFDKEIIDTLAPSVKWIAHNGAGYDQIDVAHAKTKGIKLYVTFGF